MTTTTEFLTEVRQAAAPPDSTVPGDQDVDFLRWADEELRGIVLAMMMANRDEHFVAYKDYTVTSGISKYQIPSRSIGGKLRDVSLLVNGQASKLTRMDPQEITDYSTTQNGFPGRFYMENAHIVLFPTPNTTSTLRVRYFTRPGKLILPAAALVSTAVSVAAGIADVTVVGAANQAYDVISGSSPFPLMAADTAQNIPATGTHYTFNFSGETAYFANSQVNYLCNPGYSPVVQLPDELIPVLVQRTAGRYMQSKDQFQGAKACFDRAQELQQSALILLSPRTDGNPKRMGNGPLWKSGYWASNGGWWR